MLCQIETQVPLYPQRSAGLTAGRSGTYGVPTGSRVLFLDHAGGGIVWLSNQFLGAINWAWSNGLTLNGPHPIPSGTPRRILLVQFDVDSRF
jgi:hypothetical protein